MPGPTVVVLPWRGRSAVAVSTWLGGGRRRPTGPGGPKGWMGRLAAGPIEPNLKENSFRNKN
jgi:hypothetical protein